MRQIACYFSSSDAINPGFITQLTRYPLQVASANTYINIFGLCEVSSVENPTYDSNISTSSVVSPERMPVSAEMIDAASSRF